MDVHRARFVPYPTPAITALAFSRSSDDALPNEHTQPALKLAIGRVNGDVEIWDPNDGCWTQESVLLGENKSIDALVWTREPDEQDYDGNLILGQHRLFSITAAPAVTEWDLRTGKVKRQSTGNLNEVWCLAAQPRAPFATGDGRHEPGSQDLVAGCEDGSLIQLSTADDDLQYKRTLARVAGKKARCMSVVYQTRNKIVAGFADSTIRVYDAQTASNIRNLSIGSIVPGAPKDVLVWKVKCLPNGDIVSGDSNGDIRFWDGTFYNMRQRIQGHDTDCVEIVTSLDGNTVFSGGLNGKIASYRQSTDPAGRSTWAKGQHRKIHTGDMKAMATFDSPHMSVVVSGGSDAAPIVTPLRESAKGYRYLPGLPQGAPVASARRARYMVSWWNKSIWIWHMSRQQLIDLAPGVQSPRKLVAKIDLDTRQKIRSVSISDDGRALAVSTNTEVKLFQLRKRPDHDTLSIRKLDLPRSVATSGARWVKFSPDGKWLAAVAFGNDVQIMRLAPVPSKPKYLQVLDRVVELERHHRKKTQQSGLAGYERTVNQVAFAPDSSVLAVGDLAGYVDTWVLEGNEDLTAPAVEVGDSSKKSSSEKSSSDDEDDEDATFIFYGQHWTDNPAGHLFPKLDAAALVFSFRVSKPTTEAIVNGNPGIHPTRHNPHPRSHELPHGQHRLWVMTTKHHMYEFDVLAGRLSDWSREHPTSALPKDFTKLTDRVVGIVWDVTADRDRLWLYGSSWLFMLDSNLDWKGGAVQQPEQDQPRDHVVTSDRKRKGHDGEGGTVGKRRDTRNGPTSITPKVQSKSKKGKAAHSPKAGVTQRTGGGHADDALIKVDVDEADDGPTQPIHAADDQIAVRDPSASSPQRKWWFTFKYRHVLGVVPLDEERLDEREDDGRPLEVVIVERPPGDSNYYG